MGFLFGLILIFIPLAFIKPSANTATPVLGHSVEHSLKLCKRLYCEYVDLQMESKNLLSDHLTSEIIDKALEKIRSNPECAVPGCHYEIAREDRHQAVVEFVRDHFKPDEPLARSIPHLYPWNEDADALWMLVMKQNVSLILVSDTTGQIVAVRVSNIGRKGHNLVDPENVKPEGLRKIFGLLGVLYSLCDVYEHYNVDEYFGFVALGVHKDYRRRGIGLKIQNAAVNMVKNFELGPIVLKGEGTSNFSKKIYEKLKFDILAEVVYEDYNENGEVVFKNMGDDKSIKLYGKVVG